MKRTLIGVITLGLLAFAILANAQPAKHRVAKHSRTLAASAAICSDPSHCPVGCSASSGATAMPSSGQIKANAGACQGMDPSKCPASCRKAAAGAAADNVASR